MSEQLATSEHLGATLFPEFPLSDRRYVFALMSTWRKSDWFHSRYVEIAGGRWIVWADESEIERLKRLRSNRQSRTKGHPAYPVELTTPKPRPNENPQ